MRFFSVRRALRVKGEILVLGDKSIACRAIIISAISRGKTAIENFPPSEDCLSAIKTFQDLGIKITHNRKAKRVTIFGNGLNGLKKPKGPVFVGESGTTLRLTLGVLAGQKFRVTLTAGGALSQRPMLRVTVPLRKMGAIIKPRIEKSFICLRESDRERREEYPPITINGGSLKPIAYRLPVASAQVKSAVLLAGLYAEGKTRVTEPFKTRDHTERMLRLFKADIKVKQNTIVIKGGRGLASPGRIFLPGDISSASFFMVLAAILPNSRILLRNVSLNPSRTGIIKVLRRMGADIKFNPSTTLRVDGERPSTSLRTALSERSEPNGRSRTIKIQNSKFKSYEPMGDLLIKSSKLKSTVVRRAEIPSLIDELPILMVAASFAQGKSVFEGVGELRVKETDRIRSMSENLKKMGADIRVLSVTSRGGSAKNFGGKTARSEQIIVQGVRALSGATVKSFQDHRTAMSMVVAGLAAAGQTHVEGIACINKSFPNFLSLIKNISQ